MEGEDILMVVEVDTEVVAGVAAGGEDNTRNPSISTPIVMVMVVVWITTVEMDALILATDGGVNTRDGGQLTVGLLQIVMDAAAEADEVGGGSKKTIIIIIHIENNNIH